MAKPPKTISEILELIQQAESTLTTAEHAFDAALQAENFPQNTPELTLMDDLLQAATHETASTLGFMRQDLVTLIARAKVRAKYPQISSEHLNEIANSAWSIGLVQQFHPHYAQIPLAEFSVALKNIILDWQALPKLTGNYPQLK